MTKKVIIFGAGYHGRNALRSCKKKHEGFIFCRQCKKIDK